MLDADDYMLIVLGVFVVFCLVVTLGFCGTIITKPKPIYPMFNMRCLIVADSITTIEQTCTVLSECHLLHNG